MMPSPPYFTPSDGSVSLSPWMHRVGAEWKPLETALADWNPGTTLDIAREFTIDLEQVRAECGLPDDAQIRIASSWHSDSSKMGGRIFVAELTGRTVNHVRGELDGMLIGGRVHLRTTVTAGDSISTRDGAPSEPGSILFEDVHAIALGEDDGRFPVCVDDFTRTPYDPDASWFFEVDTSDLSAPFIAGSVLHMNSRDKKLVAATVADSPTPIQRQLVQELSHSLASHLLYLAMQIDEAEPLGDPTDWPIGSLGATFALFLRDANVSGTLLRAGIDARARLRATVEGTTRRQGKGRTF